MKPSLYLLITALFLVSCDQQEIDASRLVTRNETSYEINSDTPFTGVSLTYHENGQVDERVTFQNGKLDGLSELYQPNGELSYSVGFDNGGPEGVDLDTLERRYEEYKQNGELIYSVGFDNGDPDDIDLDTLNERYETLEERGVENQYYVYYEKESNNPYTGKYFNSFEVSEYTRSGNTENLMGMGTMVEGRLAKEEGITYTFNIESEWWLQRKFIWEDGRNIEATETYHSNGQLRDRVRYKDEKQDGIFETYHSNGQLEDREHFKDGEPVGIFESFYEDGTLDKKWSYKDGVPEGIWEDYRDGELVEKGSYKNGVREGIWERYSDSTYFDFRTIRSRTKYENGEYLGSCSSSQDCTDFN